MAPDNDHTRSRASKPQEFADDAPRVTRTASALRSDARGAVYIEFIIAFIPMFIFFLGMIQLAFMHTGKMVVDMAARKAVRTAIVQLDNPEICINGGSSQTQTPFLSTDGISGAQGDGVESSDGNDVMDKIRASAYLPLAVLAPRLASYPIAGGVLQSAGAMGEQTGRMVAGYFIYARGAAAITLRREDGTVIEPAQIRDEEELGDGNVRVKVSYVFPCIVPLVNRIMCRPLHDITGLGSTLEEAGSRVQNSVNRGNIMDLIDDVNDVWDEVETAYNDASEGVDEASEAYKEIGRAEYPALLLPWALSHLRFYIFSGEATLPRQTATYARKEVKESCGDGDS